MLTFDDKGGWGGQKTPKTCLRNTWIITVKLTKVETDLFFLSEKYVPAATIGNKYFYKVFCEGPCNVEIELLIENSTHDVDLFAR